MLKMFFLFKQLLICSILFGYLQFRYLEYLHRKLKDRRTPIQAKYQQLKQRVYQVDNKLQQLNRSYLDSLRFFDSGTDSGFILDRNGTTNGTKNHSNPKTRLIQPNWIVLATKIVNDPGVPCSPMFGDELTLVVMVYNRVNDFVKRDTIRNTFGKLLKDNPRTRIYFVVGRDRSYKVELLVDLESSLHHDLIRLDFIEDYYNCTIKAIAITRWISLYCPFSKFVLKLDDDSYVRVNPLLSQLRHINPHFIMGRLNSMSPVYRDIGENNPVTKWRISHRDYPNKYYPPYIVGIYLIPGVLMIDLYESIVSEPLLDSTIPALPFDDVYITGIVARKARIVRIKLKTQLFLKNGIQWNSTVAIRKMMDQYSILWDGLKPNGVRKLWNIYGSD